MGHMSLLGAGKAPAIGGGGYSAEASQFFSRITDPGTTRKDAYAAMIDALVSGGVWSKLDAAWVLAADIEANALINLTSSSFSAAVVGTLTFTADSGFTTNGTAGNVLDTNYNPSTAGGNYVQNSACYGVWVATNTGGVTGRTVMGNDASTTHIYPAVSNNWWARINDGSASGPIAAKTTNDGFHHANRSSSTAIEGYLNGSLSGTQTQASTAVTNAKFYIFSHSTSPATLPERVTFAFIGGSLTSGEASTLYSAINTNKWW